MGSTWFIEQFLTTKLIATVIIAVIVLTIRYFAARYIRAADKNWTSQQRLRWIGSIRTIFFIILLMSIIYIWGETIQGFAVSVFAIAFALVFSVKELFMCLNGSLVRFRGHLYDIGDRIEINGMRGDVIDTTLLSTTINEVGKGAANHQFTGRRLSFSNSLLLKAPVFNESFLENYYMNNMIIPLKVSDDWKGAKALLLQIAQEECAPYIEQARRRIQQIERSKSLELPSVEPRVTIRMLEHNSLHLYLRFPSPVHLKGRLEQVVLTRFLDKFHFRNVDELGAIRE